MPVFGLLTRRLAVPAAIVLTSLVTVTGPVSAAPDMTMFGPFEGPGQLTAAETLPAAMLTGPFHAVQDRVANDGLVNVYSVFSKFGRFSARGQVALATLIDELDGLALLDEVTASAAFKAATAAADTSPAAAYKGFVVDHVADSHRGWRRGTPLGRVFGDVGRLINESRTDPDDPLGATLIRFNEAKRRVAVRLGVDPYSTNMILQSTLDSVAWAVQGGGFPIDAIPTGADAVDVTQAGLADDLIFGLSPYELRNANALGLANIGLVGDSIDLLVEGQAYSPSILARLVAAMQPFTAVKGVVAAGKTIAAASHRDVALYRLRQMQLLSRYHARVSPVKLFFTSPPIIGAQAENGAILLVMPFDHVAWTENMATILVNFTDLFRRMQETTAMELWVEGRASDRTRRELESLGWTVHDHAGEALSGG